MTEELKQTIKEEMQMLSKESQEAINAFSWEKISEEIGKKHFLNNEEINLLQADISLVMLGILEQEFLSTRIENDVITSKEEAKIISEEIIQQIYKPTLKTLEQNIKKSLSSRSIHWKQNLDFILSGGDYTAFIRRVEEEKKDEVPKPNETFNPSKLDDLKSKFTI